MSEPLVVGDDVRADRAGAPVLERFSFTSSGRSLAVVGEGASALVAALAGEIEVLRGSLRVLGRAAGSRELAAVLGAAPLDPPLVADFTVAEHVAWGARLGGASARDARADAARTLERLGLARIAATKLGRASLAERRAAVVAQAAVGAPEVVVACSPFEGLDDAGAALVGAALERAVEGRAFVVAISSIDPSSRDRAIAASADETLVVAGGAALRAAPLAELERGAASYSLVVRARVDALVDALRARGVEVAASASRLFVTLPPGEDTRLLLEASLETSAPIASMTPFVGPAAATVVQGVNPSP